MYELLTEEIQMSRTGGEIYTWVFATLEKFNTDEGKVAVRLLATNEIKVLVEESYPIAIFSNEYYADNMNTKITQIVGNQNYDANVENDTNEPKIEFLEVTQAIDGQLERFRMEELIANGHVTGGRVFYNRRLPRGERVSFSNMAESSNEIIQEILETIKIRVADKARKPYQANTALLIAFDDRNFVWREEINSLNEFAENELVPLINNFVLLALVGISKGTVLTYQISH